MILAALQQGDIVDVVAPASACKVSELKAGIKAIRAMGLVPRVPAKLFGKSVLFSNSDERRLADLKKAVFAKDSKMIWCVRGGYGALRLMPEILKWKKPATGKIFLGYSDVTTLHAHFNQKWNWPTLHGPLLDRVGRGQMSPGETRELKGLIFGTHDAVEFTGLAPLNPAARRAQSLRGEIHGGNLTVLQSSLGTPSEFRPQGGMIFFEDTGERPHRVDRMLTQAAQAGWFDDCRAVLFGHFLLHKPLDRRHLWNDVIARFAASVKIPVVRGVPVGHHPKSQRTLPLNTPAVLTLGSTCRLEVASGIEA